MTIRVTDNMRYASTVAAMQRSAAELQRATLVASSGRRIARPADGPAAYASVVAKDAKLAKLTERGKAVDRTRGDLQLAEGALSAGSDLLKRARELATQMADGGYDSAARQAAADEVGRLREQLIGLANSGGARGYLFAGTATSTLPFTSGGQFVANDGTMGVEIANEVIISANVSGANAFTAQGGVDAFQVLADLQTNLLADNQAGIQQAIADTDQAHQQITAVRADAGVLLERLRSAREVVGVAVDTVRAARASDVEADAVAALTSLTQAQGAYQQSLQVARNILSMVSAAQRW